MIYHEIRLFKGATIGYMELTKDEPPTVELLSHWVRRWRKKEGKIRCLPQKFEVVIAGTKGKRTITYCEPCLTYKHFVKIVATGSVAVTLFVPEKDCNMTLQLMQSIHMAQKEREWSALHVTMNRVSIDSERYTRCKHALKRVLESNQMKVERLKSQAAA